MAPLGDLERLFPAFCNCPLHVQHGARDTRFLPVLNPYQLLVCTDTAAMAAALAPTRDEGATA
eukprot:scaffold48156_cov30-Tisochrysis_lutea.AAC.2